MSEIITRAVIEPADPPPPALAEVALAASRSGVLDARPGPVTVHYTPTFIYNVSAPAGPGAAAAVAFARPERRRYSLAEVVFIAGRVLIAGGVADLVAIERARCGRLLKLTRAESVYLDEMTGTKPAGSGEWS
jgi:hypothetical protein